MSTTVDVPNGTVPLSPTTVTTTMRAAPPPEIEATISRLSAYRNVRGVMILMRGGNASGSAGAGAASGSGTTGAGTASSGIIQSSGAVFEGETGRRYAGALEAVVNATAGAVAACNEGDELRLMRIRTKRHELIITPDERYLLVVLQDPGQ